MHASKVPGTRDNHAFVPGAWGLNISRVSGQETDFVSSSVICAETTANTKPTSLTPGTYVTCLHDGHWWVGCIQSMSKEYGNHDVVFMHLMGHHKHFDGHKGKMFAECTYLRNYKRYHPEILNTSLDTYAEHFL